MIDYVRAYRVNGRLYGLEKTEAGYKLWGGGCGLGSAEDLETAESTLYAYIRSQISAEYYGTQERLSKLQRVLSDLGTDVFHLSTFASPQDCKL